MEAAQAWRLLLGLPPHLKVDGAWPEQPGFVAASLHYGIGISALWHLRQCGLNPRFVFRPVQRSDLPGRPIKLAWYRLRTLLIQRLCPDGPIATGGASEQILQAIDAKDATPVVLFDTPQMEPGNWRLRLGQAEISLRSGGMRLLSESGADVAFFIAGLNPDTGHCELRITGLDNGPELKDQMMHLMQAAIEAEPGFWLLWHAADDFFVPVGNQATQADPES